MESVFLLCAILGGTVMLFQFIMLALGFGADSDIDIDIEPEVDIDGGAGHSHLSGFLKVLSFRTIVAFVAFFGITGMACLRNGLNNQISLIIAFAAGMAAFLMTYFVYRWMYSMRYDGAVTEKTLLGAVGNVYLPIPEHAKGAGKVQLSQQSRTMEYEAITEGESLPSGTPIVVTRVVSSTTVEVKKVQ